MTDNTLSHHRVTSDLDDLSDQLSVMETIVEELRVPMKPTSEVRIFMTQYRHLEDTVLTGIEYHMKLTREEYKQKRLMGYIEKFNAVGFEFQETWSEAYWRIYEEVKEGKTQTQGVRDRSVRQLAKDIAEVQDLALGLSKLDRHTRRNSVRRPVLPKPQILLHIDQESRQFRENETAKSSGFIRKRKCQPCCVY